MRSLSLLCYINGGELVKTILDSVDILKVLSGGGLILILLL